MQHCTIIKGCLDASSLDYRIAETFRYQALKAYFCGLIFIVCPEHVIVVAYCLVGSFFIWGLSVLKIKSIYVM